MTLQDVLEEFILSRKLEGCTDKTIGCYQSFCMPFVAYIGSDFDIFNLNRTMVNSYIQTLYNRSLSRASISTYVRHIKIFLAWIEEEYNVSFQCEKIKVPKMPKKVLHIYTDDEIRLIFDSVVAENDWLVARNRCIIAFMLDSGLRQNEVCTLQRIDVNYQSHTLKVHGKGNKERVVPFGKISQHYLQVYTSLCPYMSDNVFVSRHGGDITTNTVKLFVQKMARTLPFPFSSHKLRHNFATNYCINQLELRGQVDIYSLMILMGHENVKTTERYLHFAHQIIASKNAISHLDKVLVS